jgi:hypothetical protein
MAMHKKYISKDTDTKFIKAELRDMLAAQLNTMQTISERIADEPDEEKKRVQELKLRMEATALKARIEASEARIYKEAHNASTIAYNNPSSITHKTYSGKKKKGSTIVYKKERTVAELYSNPIPLKAEKQAPAPLAAPLCGEPDCKVCGEERGKEPEELSARPQLHTGLRVAVDLGDPTRQLATVINFTGKGLPKGHVAICLDVAGKIDEVNPFLDELTGIGYGRFVPWERIRIRDDQSSYRALNGIPAHIGVTVIEDARVDEVKFKAGQTGRIVTNTEGSDGRTLINWNFTNKNFYDPARGESIPSGKFTRCYSVPQSILAYCRMDFKQRPTAIWPHTGTEDDTINFQAGDYVRAVIVEPQRISNGIRHFRISPGTIMRYQGPLDRHKSQVILAGGCDPAIIGLATTVGTKGLEKLEGEFLEAGTEVEIVASLDFRKRDLKGLRAVIVLPMDQDGEIGLQFREDIGAGSLDGHGQDKRCLYIHHSTMKKVAE